MRRDGVAHSDPQVKANILNDQFAGAFTEEDTSSLPSLGPSPFPDVPAFEISTAGVKKLLRGLKPHKASGPDNIYASSAWDPYTQSSINKLESVQRRAARFVTGEYRTTCSVSEVISNLVWETLQERGKDGDDVQDYIRPY